MRPNHMLDETSGSLSSSPTPVTLPNSAEIFETSSFCLDRNTATCWMINTMVIFDDRADVHLDLEPIHDISSQL